MAKKTIKKSTKKVAVKKVTKKVERTPVTEETPKKVMKKVTVKSAEVTQEDRNKARNIVQKFMKKFALVFNETKLGAMQWRRNGDVVLAACRHAFKVTLPKDAIKDLAPNSYSCAGNAHMSWIPYGEVTSALVERRLEDKRSTTEIEQDVYEAGMSPAKTRYYETKAVVEGETKKEEKATTKKKVAIKEKGKKKVKVKVAKKTTKKVSGKLAKKAAEATA